jgi:hypothetical protein
LGYTLKKGKAAFATPKPRFVKSNGRYYNRCKQVGHLEINCNKMNKNNNKFHAKMDVTPGFLKNKTRLIICVPRKSTHMSE